MREMKETGVVWCPSIPSDWELRRVKDCFTISKVKAGIKNPTVLKLARSGIQVKDVTVNEGQMAENYDDYNPVQIGDLLLNPMDLYSGANCNVSEVEGVISPAYVNLRAKARLNPFYFDYYFKLQYWAMAMFAHGKGVSYDNRWTINAEGVKSYEVPFPTIEEQNRIVEIIKNKCSQIDALIANAEQQITKLKAYKQSVITETVTKGLDPDVQMKDSGVEWIGEIPEQCSLLPMKYLAEAIGDGIHSTPNYDINGNIFFINGNNIGEEQLHFKDSTNRLNANEYANYKAPLLTDNTILITLNGATYGKTSFYNNEPVLLGKSAGYITLKPYVNKRYIRYYLQSSISKLIMDLSLAGTTIQNVSLRTLNTFTVVYPEIKEQERIVAYLDHKCSQIDKLIALKQQKIEKLQQYKKSLIYEYVTGKKEV